MKLPLLTGMCDIKDWPEMGDINLTLKLTEGSKPKRSYPGFMHATFMMTAEKNVFVHDWSRDLTKEIAIDEIMAKKIQFYLTKSVI